jgi:hypothetical protein
MTKCSGLRGEDGFKKERRKEKKKEQLTNKKTAET